jgi:hypothetical protein
MRKLFIGFPTLHLEENTSRKSKLRRARFALFVGAAEHPPFR